MKDRKLGVTKYFKEDRMKITIILFVTHKVVLIYSTQTFKPGPTSERK